MTWREIFELGHCLGTWVSIVLFARVLLRLRYVEKFFARLNERHDLLEQRIDDNHRLRQNLESRVWQLEDRRGGPYR